MMDRIVEVTGAFDRRHPDPNKNYGIHGMALRFVLKGDKGAVQFVVYTNMHLPHVHEERYARRKPGEAWMDAPMGADIGYHAYAPQYEGQSVVQVSCPYLNGAPCYYDGFSLQAEEFMPEFLAGGSEAVWKMLEQRYRSIFGVSDNPTFTDMPPAWREKVAAVERSFLANEMYGHSGDQEQFSASRNALAAETVAMIEAAKVEGARWERRALDAEAALVEAGRRFAAGDNEGVRLLLCDMNARENAAALRGGKETTG